MLAKDTICAEMAMMLSERNSGSSSIVCLLDALLFATDGHILVSRGCTDTVLVGEFFLCHASPLGDLGRTG